MAVQFGYKNVYRDPQGIPEWKQLALYAFAKARSKRVICFAHVTNQMASVEGDFEKGAENGCRDALRLVATVARLWQDFS